MKNCGQHCGHRSPICPENVCTLKPHAFGAHVYGCPPCETGSTIRYVDQATADMYPPCGFDGVLTSEEVQKVIADLSDALPPDVILAECPRHLTN